MEEMIVSSVLRRRPRLTEVSSVKDPRVCSYMAALLMTPASMPLLRGLSGEKPTELENAFISSTYNLGATPACAGVCRPRAGQSGWQTLRGMVVVSRSFLLVTPLGRRDGILCPPDALLVSERGEISPEPGTRVPLLFRTDVRPSGCMLPGMFPGYNMQEDAGRLAALLFLHGSSLGGGAFSVPTRWQDRAASLCSSLAGVAAVDKGAVSVMPAIRHIVECFRFGRITDAVAKLTPRVQAGVRQELIDRLTAPCEIYRIRSRQSARITAVINLAGLGHRLNTRAQTRGICQVLLPEDGRLLREEHFSPHRRPIKKGVWRTCSIDRVLFPGRCVYPVIDNWMIHSSGLVFSLRA